LRAEMRGAQRGGVGVKAARVGMVGECCGADFQVGDVPSGPGVGEVGGGAGGTPDL